MTRHTLTALAAAVLLGTITYQIWGQFL